MELSGLKNNKGNGPCYYAANGRRGNEGRSIFAKKPFIFSSATLSNEKKFDYIANSLGIKEFLSFSVNSPFDYQEKMEVFLPKFNNGKLEEKLDYCLSKIVQTEGRALILLNNQNELKSLKQRLSGNVPYPVYFEGDEGN